MRAFTITWGDKSWTDEQIVSAHVISVADLLGTDVAFDVSPWDGVKQLAAWLAILLAADRVTGLAELTEQAVQRLTSECLAEVYASRPDRLLEALKPRLSPPETSAGALVAPPTGPPSLPPQSVAPPVGDFLEVA